MNVNMKTVSPSLGSLHNVEVYSGPIPLQGRNLRYSIVHDISDRKKAEEDREKLIDEPQPLSKKSKP